MKRLLALLGTFALALTGLAAPPAIAVGSPMQIEVEIADTDLSGSLDAEEARAGVPLIGSVNVTVDWGDGSALETITSDGFHPHTYAAAGTYTISVTGSANHWGFTGNPADRSDGAGGDGNASGEMSKITRVISWGDLGLTSLEYGLAEATQLVDVPADFPSTVTMAHALFIKAHIFNDPDIVTWDMSNVEIFRSMFWAAWEFNQPIGSWNTSSATDMRLMFNGASSFNQPVETWDTSNVFDFGGMFASATSFDQSVGQLDLSSVTVDNIFALHSSGISTANASKTLIDLASRVQPSAITLDVNRAVTREAMVAARVLEDEYGWSVNNISLVPEAPISVTMEPSRNFKTGFGGIAWDFDGPIIKSGYTAYGYNTFDDFGYLTLSDNDTQWVTFENLDYESCQTTLDGEAFANQAYWVGQNFKTVCTSREVSIGGGSLRVQLTLETQGSYIRYSAELLEVTGTVSDLTVRFGGNLASNDETVPELFVDENGNYALITSGTSRDKVPIVYQTSEDFTLTSAPVNGSPVPDAGEDEIHLDFGTTSITENANLIDLTMLWVERDNIAGDDALTLEYARKIANSAEATFGMCLAVLVMDWIPPVVDECALPDGDAPFNFVSKLDDAFLATGFLAEAGASFLYENVTTSDGKQVNARVRIESLENSFFDSLYSLDVSPGGSRAAFFEWSLLPMMLGDFNSPEGSRVRAEIRISFEDESGRPLSIPSLNLNAYGLGLGAAIELPAFREYFVSDNSAIDVGVSDAGWTQFSSEDLNEFFSSAASRTDNRVMVSYEQVSQIKFALSAPVVNGITYASIELGSGFDWSSPTNPNGDIPIGVTNFVDYPHPASPPRVTEYSATEVSSCRPTVITLLGQRLAASSAVIGGLAAKVLESSSDDITLEIPAGLTPGQVYDLVLSGEGSLTLQGAIRAVATDCSSPTEVLVWTKRISASEVKFYAKKPVGAGKLQFMVDGKEVAWINAVDESDPKLSFAKENAYFVRTVRLATGKNALEVYADGTRVWRAAYTG